MNAGRRIVAGLAFAAFAACASHADPAELRATLDQRYQAYQKAIADRDVTTLGAMLAPNYEAFNVDGQRTEAKHLLEQVGSFPRDPNLRTSAAINSVTVVGDEATVDVTSELHSKVTPHGAKPVAIDFVTRSTDTWIGKGGTWLLERSVATRVDQWADGKRVLHKVRPLPQLPTISLPTP